VIHKITLAVFVFLGGCSLLNQPSQAEVDELKATLARETVGEIVRQIYEDREFRPLWIARGRTTEKLQQFFQFVDDQSHGIHTNVEALRQERPSNLIQYEIDVTSALVKHASGIARKEADIRHALDDAIDLGMINQLGERLAPKYVEYDRLRTALQTAPGDTATKIELNMDRWRKLPDDLGPRHIRVNIPSYQLEVHDDGDIPLRMRVVVGANDKKTPLFSSDMKSIVFSPYWNIPESIMTEETLPKIEEDPEYLEKQNLEVVWEGEHFRLRQKPGAGNSLGLVKFMFPNVYNVYLHDTPADNLFAKLTRNLSHGCIRVEKPEELAAYVLQDQPEWTPEKIRKAMHAGVEKHVPLKEPLPVHILYFTAWVDDTGMLHLEKDVYGYDQQ
jgi:murein L,D-transpeptidase YcbB/YkuD